MLEKIRVVEAKRKDGKVVSVSIDAEGIIFCFYRKRGGGISFTKSKPDAQLYDPNNLWVPDDLFKEICRQAATILYPPSPSAAGRDKLSSPGEPALNPKNVGRKKEKVSFRTFRRPPANCTLPLPF